MSVAKTELLAIQKWADDHRARIGGPGVDVRVCIAIIHIDYLLAEVRRLKRLVASFCDPTGLGD